MLFLPGLSVFDRGLCIAVQERGRRSIGSPLWSVLVFSAGLAGEIFFANGEAGVQGSGSVVGVDSEQLIAGVNTTGDRRRAGVQITRCFTQAAGPCYDQEIY